MEHKTFRDVLGDQVLAPGVEDVLLWLEANEWYPRTRMGSNSIRYWPDGQRGKQISIDVTYPMNKHRWAEYREFTGIGQAANVNEKEGADER